MLLLGLLCVHLHVPIIYSPRRPRTRIRARLYALTEGRMEQHFTVTARYSSELKNNFSQNKVEKKKEPASQRSLHTIKK